MKKYEKVLTFVPLIGIYYTIKYDNIISKIGHFYQLIMCLTVGRLIAYIWF